MSLISAGMTGVYSSGLALLAMGVPLSRAATTVVNAVIITLGAFSLHFGLLRLDLPVVPRSDLRDHGLLGRH